MDEKDLGELLSDVDKDMTELGFSEKAIEAVMKSILSDFEEDSDEDGE